MYIFLSILGAICGAGMILLDQIVLKDASRKFTLLVKSGILLVFATILVAFNESFNHLLDFTEIEWLYFIIMTLLIAGIFFIYHFTVDTLKPAIYDGFKYSGLLIFVNIFFLIFSMKNIMPNQGVANIIVLVVELLCSTGVVVLSFLNKGNRKANLLLTLGVGALAAGFYIMNFTVCTRQTFEIFFFWGMVVAFVTSIIMFLTSKEERKAFKKNRWQSYLLILMAACCCALVYIFAFRASLENGARAAVINMIIGFSFIPLLVYDFLVKFKGGMKVKEYFETEKYAVSVGVLLSFALVCHMLTAIL